MNARWRVVALVATAAQAIACGVLLAWSVADWGRVGWIGMAYQAFESETFDEIPLLNAVGLKQGEVTSVYPGSPAERAGVRRGDRVISVEGHPSVALPKLREVGRRSRVPADLSYKVQQRTGEELAATIRLENPFRTAWVTGSTAITIAVGLGCLGIAAFVLWRKPADPAARLLYAAGSIAALVTLIWASVEFSVADLRGIQPIGSNSRNLFYIGTIFVLTVIAVSVLLHFVLEFPRRRAFLDSNPRMIGWIYSAPLLPLPALSGVLGIALYVGSAIPLLLCGFAAAAFVAASAIFVGRKCRSSGLTKGLANSSVEIGILVVSLSILGAPMLRWLDDTGRFFAISFLVLCGLSWIVAGLLAETVVTCIILRRSFRDGTREEKAKLGWLVWGAGVSFVFPVCIAVAAAALGRIGPGLELLILSPRLNLIAVNLGKVIGILLPISFAYAILEYRLESVTRLNRRTLIHGVVWSAWTVASLLVLGLVGTPLMSLFKTGGLATAGLTGLALLIPTIPGVRILERRFLKPRSNQSQSQP